MKCDKCFFCVKIGKGIYADFPVKYCKYFKTYKLPFVMTQDHGGIKRQLDFSNIKDCKIWSNVGCDIHPSRVKKAKDDFIKNLEQTERESE